MIVLRIQFQRLLLILLCADIFFWCFLCLCQITQATVCNRQIPAAVIAGIGLAVLLVHGQLFQIPLLRLFFPLSGLLCPGQISQTTVCNTQIPTVVVAGIGLTNLPVYVQLFQIPLFCLGISLWRLLSPR